MDAAEYLPMFLAECREHLQELNLAVVRLEESPDDRETIDEIFRIAHSVKGMSATMGFQRMAELTHAMEDVFESLRHRRDGVERAAVDVLLSCLDALGSTIDDLDGGGSERLDPAPLVERLKALVRSSSVDESSDSEEGLPSLEELRSRARDRQLLHVAVELAPEVSMPAVRAYMVLEALGRTGEILASLPGESGVDGFHGRRIEVWVATDQNEEALAAAASLIPEIVSVEVGSESETASPEEQHELESSDPADGGPSRTSPARGRKTSSTVRVDAERLDQLMHFMGELVVQRTRLESLAAGAGLPGLQEAMQDLTRSSQALQAMVMQVRMIPVEAVFLRFPRLVRDLATKLGKRVELTLTGQDTELDRTVIETLGDPLVHLVRNSLDHGLEPPDERVAAGKPAAGSLEISARHAGGSVLISVRDDGRGIDPARVASKAAERGLIPPEAVDSVDMQQAVELLFAPGFSTAEETTDVSGRGVGMDAVRSAIREFGGEALLLSERGAGTTAQIRLPLTLAIMSALLVEAAGLPFALPLDRVERTLRLEEHVIRSVAGSRILVLRDGSIPLLDLADALGYPSAGSCSHAVIVHGAERRLALEVDRLIGQRELVARPLPDEVGRGVALSGGAVLASGQIALVVDSDAIAESLRGLSSLGHAA